MFIRSNPLIFSLKSVLIVERKEVLVSSYFTKSWLKQVNKKPTPVYEESINRKRSNVKSETFIRNFHGEPKADQRGLMTSVESNCQDTENEESDFRVSESVVSFNPDYVSQFVKVTEIRFLSTFRFDRLKIRKDLGTLKSGPRSGQPNN